MLITIFYLKKNVWKKKRGSHIERYVGIAIGKNISLPVDRVDTNLALCVGLQTSVLFLIGYASVLGGHLLKYSVLVFLPLQHSVEKGYGEIVIQYKFLTTCY